MYWRFLTETGKQLELALRSDKANRKYQGASSNRAFWFVGQKEGRFFAVGKFGWAHVLDVCRLIQCCGV
jgi:hypothetical protein